MAAPFPEPVHVDPGRLVDAHEHAVEFYRRQLLRGDGPRQYLASRGMGVLARPHLPWRTGIDLPWRLGYAPPGWTNLVDHLTTEGFTPKELEAAGLATRTRTGRLIDTFRDRIMLPIRNPAGRTVAFAGRAAPGAAHETPKYLNSSDSAIYHKGQTLYGLAEQRDRLDAGWAPVLVEGPFDALAVWIAHPDGAGIGRAALAPCGASLTTAQAAIVSALPGALRHGVTIAFDDDTAGHAAADRALHLLCAQGVTLHGAQLPGGSDPADLVTRPDKIAMLKACLTYRARPLAEIVIDHCITTMLTRHPRLLTEIPGQVAAVRAVASILTEVPAPEAIRLTQYVAEVTGTGIDTVTWAVREVLDAGDSVRRAAPQIRSPVTATSPQPQPQATGPPTGSTDSPTARNRRAGHTFPSPSHPASSLRDPSGHHTVHIAIGRHTGRGR